ncbi:type IV secretory system conjugative DNA transfer family protein [Cysteiniphilum sp. JM-1]|uniref:type IV secretory system conjugative DNA transfer family protein n=1 Tax=Cysteiniphilum sp. JM-1 TaxID=2610891 RepID=UPI001245B8D9|nr:TraM recognition domain-containing protein [Cysteiniphilum sp. JM-1]
MRKTFRGLTKGQESNPSASIRDTRTLLPRIRDFLLAPVTGSLTLAIISLLMFVLPSFCDLLFLIVIGIFWYGFWSYSDLPFKLPFYAKEKDPNNSPPGSTLPGKANGIYYFGNEVNSNNEIWFNNADMRTHALIFGSTGSGKTQALISIASNALLQGSGLIYVDGKGDNSLYAQIFSLARQMGREDDLLVVNFMTGAKDIIGTQKQAISNTLNPFANGSSSMLSELIASMLGGSKQGGGNDDMWKGRAIAFVHALMRLLVYLRDQGYFLLDAALIRKYFVLDVLENLIHQQQAVDQEDNIIPITEKLPFSVSDPINNYLATLPGYQIKNVGKQDQKAYEQHGYITMQLTRVFNSLADVYAHIMKTNLGEVNFSDVVLNRRILVVLLPALEKSPDELSNLGKLIIASLKAMLAEGLGSALQGSYNEVIESKPSNANTPFLCVLDEYGYYAVEGFAVVPAQARSLGFSVVFAGQDLPAFQKASKEEAASIFANTNIKICMKLEDPTETWDFFSKTAGETYVSVAKSYNMGDAGTSLGYRDTREATIEKRARLDLMDLKDQREGEAHIFFKSQIVRAKMFYANPAKTKALRLNEFLKIEPLSAQTLDSLKRIYNSSHLSIQAEIKLPEFESPLLNALIDEAQNTPVITTDSISRINSNLQNFDDSSDHLISTTQERQHDETDNVDTDIDDYVDATSNEITPSKHRAENAIDFENLDIDDQQNTESPMITTIEQSEVTQTTPDKTDENLLYAEIDFSLRINSCYYDFEQMNYDNCLCDREKIEKFMYHLGINNKLSKRESRRLSNEVADQIGNITQGHYISNLHHDGFDENIQKLLKLI